jgi:hypothetical protein
MIFLYIYIAGLILTLVVGGLIGVLLGAGNDKWNQGKSFVETIGFAIGWPGVLVYVACKGMLWPMLQMAWAVFCVVFLPRLIDAWNRAMKRDKTGGDEL